MAGTRFDALEEFLDDTLTLPVPCTDGKTRDFAIPSPSAEDGLRIEAIMSSATRAVAAAENSDGSGPADADMTVLDDAAEADLYRLALGSVYEELRAQAKWTMFRHVAMTAVMWHTAGVDTARRYWTTGADPEAVAPNRAQRRAASSAAASKTRSRGSTSGTKAQPRSRAAAKS